jgi:hypothetical protein
VQFTFDESIGHQDRVAQLLQEIASQETAASAPAPAVPNTPADTPDASDPDER